MRLARTAILSALALNALLGVGMAVRAQSVSTVNANGTLPFYTTSGTATLSNAVFKSNANGTFTYIGAPPQLPAGAIFHQVVDIYYDGDGNKVETKSYTHVVDADCHGGLRRQDQERIVQDNGKGGVVFVQARLASEPMAGEKPVSREGVVRAMLAAKAGPVAEPAPAKTVDVAVAPKDTQFDMVGIMR